MHRRETVLNPVELKHVYTNPTFLPEEPTLNGHTSPVRPDVSTVTSTQTPSQSPSDDPKKTENIALKKSISFFSCAAILIAVTGHVSIFVSPSAILVVSGSVGASLIIWLVGGLINLTQALCFAELGTVFPKAGGPYAYVLKTFGPLPGFLILWGYLILIAGPFWAFLAHTAAFYLLKPAFINCNPPETGVKLLAGWIIITVVALNCVYMKYVTKAQSFLTIAKIFALLMIVIGGIVLLAQGNHENFEEPFKTTSPEAGKIAMAIFYSIFSYGGWQVMTSLVEEMKNPGRDLPLAVYCTFSVVIIKYILTNVAYYVLLSISEISQSKSVALDFINRLYSPITPLVAVFVALASIGALNASVMGHPRLLFAGARLGHAPKLMGMLHEQFKVPWPATFTLCIWSLIMLYTGGLLQFMSYISLYATYMGLNVTLALLYYRWKAPDVHRPYKVNLVFPIFQVLINTALLILGIYEDPKRIGTALAIIFGGIPVYWLGVLWKDKPADFVEMIEIITVTCQKIFNIRAAS